jgi:hypothetical protein
MRKPLIVGLCGHIGHGKTHLANLIAAMANDGCPGMARRISVADSIRDIAEIICGSRIDTPGDKDFMFQVGSRMIRGRTILQHIGTEMGRQLDPDLWVASFVRRAVSGDHWLVLVDDIRFQNEAAGCDVIIGIRKENCDIPAETHETEKHVDLLISAAHLVVAHDGTEAGYKPSVDNIMDFLTEQVSALPKRS